MAQKFVSPIAPVWSLGVVSTLLAVFVITSNATTTSGQIPTMPPVPNDDLAITVGQPALSPATPTPPSPPTNIPPPTIEITSPHDGQRVPVGELTIKGISSDDKKSACRVYVDVNDITPMRNASGIDFGDHSRWNFKYTQDYKLITEGSNELTAKISCFAPGNPIPLSEWDTVNVTGVAAADTVDGEEENEEDQE
jgi:hypothetical protein